MKKPQTTWLEAKESVKNLNATIDKVQKQLMEKPGQPGNPFEELFKGFKKGGGK